MRLSITTLNRLGVLSREIRHDHDSLLKLEERTRRGCNEVIAETILLGTKLTEAKKLVGHGNWAEWLAKHCPDICERTAQRYIRLSKTTHVSDLKSNKSLRQAYIAFGILSVEESKPLPAVQVLPERRQLQSATDDGKAIAVRPVIEATVVERPAVVNEPRAVAVTLTPMETPVTRVKGKVGDLMQCLKPLDAPCRKKVAVHLKPLVIFYHRFGK